MLPLQVSSISGSESSSSESEDEDEEEQHHVHRQRGGKATTSGRGPQAVFQTKGEHHMNLISYDEEPMALPATYEADSCTAVTAVLPSDGTSGMTLHFAVRCRLWTIQDINMLLA